MLPENERIEFEDRTYVNPEASLQEQNAFIDNLRNIQNQNTAEIATDTYNLGTAVPSNLGGLGGGGSYFEARYSTPQGVALANNLRATAQAQALNDILSNEQAMMKQRYTNAQRAARQRARARYSGGGGSGGGTTGGNNGNTSGWDGEVIDVVSNGNGGLTAVGSLSLDANDVAAGGKYIVEPGSGNIIRVDDRLNVNDPNYQQTFYQQADGSYATRGGKTLSPQNRLRNNAPLSSALRSNL